MYVSVAEIKAAIGIASTDVADDPAITLAIEAASSSIDDWCHRSFDLSEPVTRLYRYQGSRLSVDDIGSLTGLALAVDPFLNGVSFYLDPPNALVDGKPWTHLSTDSGTAIPTITTSLNGPNVSVTARFGWPAVPAVVKQAARIQAMRFYKRKDAPFGISGSPDMGGEMRLLSQLDPDVQALVRPLIKGWYVC
jgi:hypothetical protein